MKQMLMVSKIHQYSPIFPCTCPYFPISAPISLYILGGHPHILQYLLDIPAFSNFSLYICVFPIFLLDIVVAPYTFLGHLRFFIATSLMVFTSNCTHFLSTRVYSRHFYRISLQISFCDNLSFIEQLCYIYSVFFVQSP